MSKAILAALAIFVLASTGFAAEDDTYLEGNGYAAHLMPSHPLPPPKSISSVPSPFSTLSDSQKQDVLKLVNTHLPPNSMPVPPYGVVDAESTDVGGGRSDVFVLLDISGRGYSNLLWIYHKDNAGKLDFSQQVRGWKMGSLKQMVRDLNGDGKDELIVPDELDWPPGAWTPTPQTPAWPTVYRRVNGKYVEDSRDFPKYYDSEVLPTLEKAIELANSRAYPKGAAMDLLEKDKILRMLGRNPTAGLNQAYKWMNSDDPTLMQCAIATFADIGGHQQEVHQLRQALPAAIKREIEARKGG